MKLNKQHIATFTAALVLLCYVLMAVASLIQQRWFSAISKETVVVTVESGQTGHHVLKILSKSTQYQYSFLDKLLFKRFPALSRVKKGEYELEAGISLFAALHRINSGRPVMYTIPLVEGLTAKQWLEQLHNNPVLDHRNLNIEQWVSSKQWSPNSMEGRLLPDTYSVSRGTSIQTVLNQAASALDSYLMSAWQDRQENLPYSSPYEALIMASIIEKETGVAEERPRIAAVFVNRLRIGMRLQTDPTVIYGMGERFDGNIRRKDLREKTAYNTYVIKGLPPTPIAMASKAAIDAALHPIKSNEYYFVAKGDGSHYFSTTLKQHNEAVYRYQIRKP